MALAPAATRLSSWICIVVVVSGSLQTHLVINLLKFLLHLLVLLIFLYFVFGILGAPELPVDRTEAEVGHGTGGIQREGMDQKRLGLLRLIHGHQYFRQANARFGVSGL